MLAINHRIGVGGSFVLAAVFALSWGGTYVYETAYAIHMGDWIVTLYYVWTVGLYIFFFMRIVVPMGNRQGEMEKARKMM